mgnify:CR=1 FL=1
MKQYEIFWAALPEPIGRRPVMLLTRASAYDYLSKIIVAEITSTVRGIPQEVKLGKTEGLERTCVANLDNIHVILKNHVKERIGVLVPEREREVKRALGYALNWHELKVL